MRLEDDAAQVALLAKRVAPRFVGSRQDYFRIDWRIGDWSGLAIIYSADYSPHSAEPCSASASTPSAEGDDAYTATHVVLEARCTRLFPT